mmetsp:Transcript_38689/g.52512  ORF Transcript_38689/g.52512 Transcript_38689/m.52512 type:complete len:92 (-) Transcript_38689:27-302(-)
MQRRLDLCKKKMTKVKYIRPKKDKKTKEGSENEAYKSDEQDSGNMSSGRENAEPCPICFEDFKEGMELCKTTCDHMFHETCITKWCLTRIL